MKITHLQATGLVLALIIYRYKLKVPSRFAYVYNNYMQLKYRKDIGSNKLFLYYLSYSF